MSKYVKTERGYELSIVQKGEGGNSVILNDLNGNVASGSYSHAEGWITTASGHCSHAEGYFTTASGQSSHAEGNNTKASGQASHAEGYGTKASGERSHSEGQNTTASGNFSHAEGSTTTASGQASHAEGYGTVASGYQSHAEGWMTTAGGHQSHAEGSNVNISGNTLSDRTIILPDDSTVTIAGSTTYGRNSHAEGTQTYAHGYSSHAEGGFTNAFGEYSHAEGYTTTASGEHSHAEGYYTTASGKASHAEGSSTAYGSHSHAEGSSTASGTNSHAEGYVTTASGYYSHAEGASTVASGNESHAEGGRTIASGHSSHAEGCAIVWHEVCIMGAAGDTVVSYEYESWTEDYVSYIVGSIIGNHYDIDDENADFHYAIITDIDTVNKTITVDRPLNFSEDPFSEFVFIYNAAAVGEGSHTEGCDTIAAGDYQHAQGRSNVVDFNGNYAHIVGNGDDATRSNAHTLDWDGNAWFAGDVYVGSTSGTNKDEGSKKLVTIEEVNAAISNALNGLKFQTYYYGADEPSADLGVDGDLYFVMGG